MGRNGSVGLGPRSLYILGGRKFLLAGSLCGRFFFHTHRFQDEHFSSIFGGVVLLMDRNLEVSLMI